MLIDHGSIFTASLVCCYVSYLTSAGLMCEPSCNSLSNGNNSFGFTILASLFTLIWAGYSAFSASYRFDACNCDEEEGQADEFSLSFFHFVFALASVYLSMVVTHWGTKNHSSAWSTDKGTTSKWVNLSASWVTLLIYSWTLFAPKILPDREF